MRAPDPRLRGVGLLKTKIGQARFWAALARIGLQRSRSGLPDFEARGPVNPHALARSM
jgi:hypothetical protein